ncbi:hypothetical protein TL16_g08475 [Triparma laevis f. inornata]|uniref:Ion transport domain-containing protein n=1 Tax=Triparma laevis f. inornata TaxID=1714386 RepID=A0A9W7EKF5_9STRA|nr:hypothetical protein TL16_g08475 [Triparma laevis f. inornata]
MKTLIELCSARKWAKAQDRLDNDKDDEGSLWDEVSKADADGRTALHHTLWNGGPATLVSAIIARAATDPVGRNIMMQQDMYGWTPLAAAAAGYDYPESIEEIIEQYEKALTIKTLMGKTPLELALENKKTRTNYVHIVRVIRCWTERGFGSTSLHFLCMHDGDFQSISSKCESMETFAELNASCKLGRSALSYYCEFGMDLGTLRLLVDCLHSLCEKDKKNTFLNRTILVHDKEKKSPYDYAISFKKPLDFLEVLGGCLGTTSEAKHKIKNMQNLVNVLLLFDSKLEDCNFLPPSIHKTNLVLLEACEFKKKDDELDGDHDDRMDDQYSQSPSRGHSPTRGGRTRAIRATRKPFSTQQHNELYAMLDEPMPNDDFTSHKGNFLPAHFICDSENITVEALELLLDTFPEEASELSKSGKLPLHVACGNEHVNVKAIELLVSVNPNAAKVTAEVQDEESKQRKSVAFNRIKQQQLEDNLLGMMDVRRAPSGLDSEDPNASDDRLALESGRTPLHFASENKAMKWDALRVVIDANPEAAKLTDALLALPLHHLAENPKVTAMAFRVMVKANPAATKEEDLHGNTPLMTALENRIPLASLEGLLSGSLGGTDKLRNDMISCLVEDNAQEVEEIVIEMALHESLDLFCWMCYIEATHPPLIFSRHVSNLFKATWSCLCKHNAEAESNPKSARAVASIRKAICRFVAMCQMRRSNLLNELINHLTPKELENIAVTRVFRVLLHEEMRSGVMTIYYFDIAAYVVLMFSFTYFTIELKMAENVQDAYKELTAVVTVSLTTIVYFLSRELSQLIAMSSMGLPEVWFRDGWNYIELIASLGSLGIILYVHSGHSESVMLIASVVSLFNWMKVLCLMKSFSQPIATFVLMTFEIIHNLGSFLSVMIVCIAMFGNALYLVLGGVEYDLHDGDQPFLTWTATSKTLYSFLFGQFDKASYDDTWSFTLFLLYSMLVVIILLNVLIAIVGDSYDSVLVKSEEMYWRSRLLLVAKMKTTGRYILSKIRKQELKAEIADEEVAELELDLTIKDPMDSWGGKILATVNRVIKSDANTSLRNDITKQRISLLETQACVELLLEKFEIAKPILEIHDGSGGGGGRGSIYVQRYNDSMRNSKKSKKGMKSGKERSTKNIVSRLSSAVKNGSLRLKDRQSGRVVDYEIVEGAGGGDSRG